MGTYLNSSQRAFREATGVNPRTGASRRGTARAATAREIRSGNTGLQPATRRRRGR